MSIFGAKMQIIRNTPSRSKILILLPGDGENIKMIQNLIVKRFCAQNKEYLRFPAQMEIKIFKNLKWCFNPVCAGHWLSWRDVRNLRGHEFLIH